MKMLLALFLTLIYIENSFSYNEDNSMKIDTRKVNQLMKTNPSSIQFIKPLAKYINYQLDDSIDWSDKLDNKRIAIRVVKKIMKMYSSKTASEVQRYFNLNKYGNYPVIGDNKKWDEVVAMSFKHFMSEGKCDSSNDPKNNSFIYEFIYQNNVKYFNFDKELLPEMLRCKQYDLDSIFNKLITKVYNKEDSENIKLLIKYDSNLKSEKNICKAIKNNEFEIATLLLNENININMNCQRTSVLRYSFNNFHDIQDKTKLINFTNKLISKKFKSMSNKEITTLLGDNVSIVRNTIGYKGKDLKEILKLLEKYKISIDSTDIIDNIASLSIKQDWYSYDPMDSMIKAKATAISLLIKYLPDINFLTKNDITILAWASKNNQYKLAKQLIEAGADIRIEDGSGYTALAYAENNKNHNMIKLIKGGTSGKQTGIDKLLTKKSSKPNYNSFALIIGINNYMDEAQVDYADNSARSFNLLAQNVLGVPKENIILLTNEKATSGQIKSNIELISQLVEKGSTLYFYYAGHGVPGTNGKTYILPFDMKADNIEIEQQLAILNIYKKFVKSPAKKIVVFMDSCFSGKDDNGKLLYKGVAPVFRNKKVTIDKSKLAVFSAGSSTDFANQYKDEEQRMFSYFVIKGLLEGKKNSDELSNYIKYSVKRKSLRIGLSYKQVPQYEGKKPLKLVE